MEASCREEGLWPCAGANAAQAQNRFARIVVAAMRFLLLLTDDGADMDGSPHFPKKILSAGHAIDDRSLADRSRVRRRPSFSPARGSDGGRCDGVSGASHPGDFSQYRGARGYESPESGALDPESAPPEGFFVPDAFAPADKLSTNPYASSMG
jgi:hypothetical protein